MQAKRTKKTEPLEFDIDLRWSLWTADEDGFAENDHNQKVLDAMKAAFAGGRPVTVNTAPKKEIRFGSVDITKGTANVHFSFEWDEDYEHLYRVEEIAPDLSPKEERDARESISMFLCELENYQDREIKADTFAELMAAIDKVESDLLESEQSQSDSFEEMIKGLGEWIKENRDPVRHAAEEEERCKTDQCEYSDGHEWALVNDVVRKGWRCNQCGKTSEGVPLKVSEYLASIVKPDTDEELEAREEAEENL
jgi:hypothetical protein